MGKKKRETAQDNEPLGNGSPQSNEKHPKKKKKNRDKVKEQQNDAVRLAPEVSTVTVAVPGSIIKNAQSYELATLLAGQVARACTIFRVDEVVVFDDKNTSEDASTEIMDTYSDEKQLGAPFLIRILRYLETPQYLRKSLIPFHKSLGCVGKLPPLDAPHHLRQHEWGSYREGVTREKVDGDSAGALVDVGLSKYVMVDQVLEPGQRVTVEMGTNRNLEEGPPRKIVPSSRPREEGMYWGYNIRYAANISSVFKDCPYQGGYDHCIGTSEHGLVIKSSELTIPSFRHLLIAFGGLAGLEECVELDENLKGKNVRDLFDSYLNTCPHQGSRTIRTEEAIFISLQYFQEPISRARTCDPSSQ